MSHSSGTALVLQSLLVPAVKSHSSGHTVSIAVETRARGDIAVIGDAVVVAVGRRLAFVRYVIIIRVRTGTGDDVAIVQRCVAIAVQTNEVDQVDRTDCIQVETGGCAGRVVAVTVNAYVAYDGESGAADVIRAGKTRIIVQFVTGYRDGGGFGGAHAVKVHAVVADEHVDDAEFGAAVVNLVYVEVRARAVRDMRAVKGERDVLPTDAAEDIVRWSDECVVRYSGRVLQRPARESAYDVSRRQRAFIGRAIQIAVVACTRAHIALIRNAVRIAVAGCAGGDVVAVWNAVDVAVIELEKAEHSLKRGEVIQVNVIVAVEIERRQARGWIGAANRSRRCLRPCQAIGEHFEVGRIDVAVVIEIAHHGSKTESTRQP